MSGDSEQSEQIRTYFIKLREFITSNRTILYQAMDKHDDLKKYSGFESIYFFAVDNRKMDWKIGRSIDIVKRLRNYNVGRIKEVCLKYYALVRNSVVIENCIKEKLKNNQVIKGKEIYRMEPKKIKKIIDQCYCKYVSRTENDDLYSELSDLLGLYSYVKDKINITPYIIIGKSL